MLPNISEASAFGVWFQLHTTHVSNFDVCNLIDAYLTNIFFFASIQSMPSIHISRRSTSQAQPTQSSKEKKDKIPKKQREYIKRVVSKKAKELRSELIDKVHYILRMRSTSGQVCPNACKGKILFTGKSFKSYFLELCSFLRNLVLRSSAFFAWIVFGEQSVLCTRNKRNQ